MDQIKIGQILIGALFDEPMRVETVRLIGADTWVVGLVGVKSQKFRTVTLTPDKIRELKILSPSFSFSGDGKLLRLGIQAYSLGIAYEFDPYFGLSISRVDPLPHQLEAVYDYLLKLARVRFLLADDAGAGKTIMAGLLIRELKLRGLAERILIVCPSNLTFQWERELKDKFDEKFKRIKGSDLDSYSMNQWLENKQIITSLDLAKRKNVLPGLRQVSWNLVIIDEAHRMSASDMEHKTLRYRLGELMRDTTEHLLLLTATPHKGDPVNFSFFLQLLDEDTYADVKSIKEAMKNRRAPFYLRRIKEAMLYFPERQPDGKWIAKKIFTKRIPHTVDFAIDGAEYNLYLDVTRFVRHQSAKAATQEDDPRARAVSFLMSLYQRRLASSTYALRCSLNNRAHRLEESLKRAHELAKTAPPELPDPEDLEEMEDTERERLESIIEAITIAKNPHEIQEEINTLKLLAEQAKSVEDAGVEAKLSRLKNLLQQEGFFDEPQKRLLIFTEFRDTLEYLVDNLTSWGFKVGFIHGGMKSGSREEPKTRLYSEHQFWTGDIQILAATEAAGEGINLHCCNVLFNYDIPWNPNRLEQRMGRIHRYGQVKDCLIFNFVATNTIEGRVLQKLLEKLQEIRNALEDDAVFNVVGEILPAAHMERILRDYYAGKLGEEDLEERFLKDVKEEKFKAICQHALEGLATKKLNLEMLIERRALAKERRVVPETIARFIRESADVIPFQLKPVTALPHTFDPASTPPILRKYETENDWKLQPLINRYPRFTTDRETAKEHTLEWVTPGHPLFEALRRHTLTSARESFAQGACFYSIVHDSPALLDFYRARIVDGLGNIIHERLFAVELSDGKEPKLIDIAFLRNLKPCTPEEPLPSIAYSPSEALEWLNKNVFLPFLEEVSKERIAEVDRITQHIEISLTELMQKADEQIGKFAEAVQRGDEGAKGLLAQAEARHQELLIRREKRRNELQRERSLTLQAVERITRVLILPHPEKDMPEVRNLKPDKEVEMIAMQTAIEFEKSEGRQVYDVHEKNLGYDLTSIDTNSGELRLIEVKGIGESTGNITFTPNEKRVSEDRRDCFWLYVVTDCKTSPKIQLIKDPASLKWHEVKKIDHYYLSVKAMKDTLQFKEETIPYGEDKE
jgi:superfamily II DNA or RNA helicase